MVIGTQGVGGFEESNGWFATSEKAKIVCLYFFVGKPRCEGSTKNKNKQ